MTIAFPGARDSIRAAALIALFPVSGVCQGPAGGGGSPLAIQPECVELNRRAMAQTAEGRFSEAQDALAAALAHRNPDTSLCAALTGINMAALISLAGRFAEAEKLAAQSITSLEKVYPPDDRALLRPLQILASTRLEQGNKAGARIALRRMQAIRTALPKDRALVHQITGTMLRVEGKYSQAEKEYLAATEVWNQEGLAATAEAAAVLMALGLTYMEEHRFEDARRTLEDAWAVVVQAKDTVPMDRIRLLNIRGVLHQRRGEWREAEDDLRDALFLADGQPALDPAALLPLLASYSQVLRRNGRGNEARIIEARAGALRRVAAWNTVVDISDLVPRPKPAK